jgi:hypothetical protein
MEQTEFHHQPQPIADVPNDTTLSRDPAPVAVPTPPPITPTVARHLFTLTVDQVAAEIFQYGFARDDRTIQRWCKAGKLSAIIDEDHGDRYLINPASLRDMLSTLTTERDARATRTMFSPRPYEPVVPAPRPLFENAPAHAQFTRDAAHDKRPDTRAAQARHDAPEADTSRDEVETLRRRIDELEKDKMMLTVDKQVREQMVDYLKEQFGSMIDQALNRSQDVGQLRAENLQLKAQLPPPASVPVHERHRFTPQQVRQQSETVHSDATWDASLEV